MDLDFVVADDMIYSAQTKIFNYLCMQLPEHKVSQEVLDYFGAKKALSQMHPSVIEDINYAKRFLTPKAEIEAYKIVKKLFKKLRSDLGARLALEHLNQSPIPIPDCLIEEFR